MSFLSILLQKQFMHTYKKSNILLIHPSTICRLFILTLLRNSNNVNSTSSTSCNFVHHTDFNELYIVNREWRFQTHILLVSWTDNVPFCHSLTLAKIPVIRISTVTWLFLYLNWWILSLFMKVVDWLNKVQWQEFCLVHLRLILFIM